MAVTIGVDVGGTTVAAGVVDEQGSVLATAQRDTPSDDPRRTEDVIVEVVGELAVSHDVEAVGVGAAGFVDAQRSTVLFAPNLAWRDEPLSAGIEGRCELPVVIENDANAAAWGEVRFGAGRGEDFVVVQYLTARGHRPHAELRVAELGPEAGIVGAGDLARDR
jgi:glucokinase